MEESTLTSASSLATDGYEQVKRPQCMVRVADGLEPGVFDTSNSAFSIVASLEEEPVWEEIDTILLPDEEVEEILERYFEEEAEALGETKLYDVLIKVGDNYSPDPNENETAMFKDGDIVTIKPAGADWGGVVAEGKKFALIQAYLTEEEVKELKSPEISETIDSKGNILQRVIRRRRYRIDMGAMVSGMKGLLKSRPLMEAGVVRDKSVAGEQ